ncbi:MAG: FkbM family methyltransferase [Prosthecobacter sp.]
MSIKKLIRLLYPCRSVRTVFRGPLRGCKFVVVPGMGFTYALGLDHFSFRFLSQKMRPGMTVYDVGANCGQMSLFFSKLVGEKGAVLAFEPVPENAALLKLNLELNDCKQVRVFEAAVAEDDKSRSFRFDSERHTMGSLEGVSTKPSIQGHVTEVPCLTLDSLMDGSDARMPDLIKIDVEGGGLGVIQGAERIIALYRPAIFFEIHASALDSPECTALNLLREKFGYSFFNMRGEQIVQILPAWGEPVWCVSRDTSK